MKTYWRYTDNAARWKYDSPFENWLSHRADHNEWVKCLYVGFYRLFDRGFYQKGLPLVEREIDTFLQSGGKLPFSRKKTVRDMVYSLHRFGTMFNEYFLFEFYNKNVYGRETFITDKRRYEYYRLMNKDENLQLFNNKWETYRLFQPYYKRAVMVVESADQLDAFVVFVKEHPTVIVKPLEGTGGRNVHKRDVPQECAQEVFHELLASGAFVVEEVVVQSDIMAQFHPASLNTVRVPTVVTGGKAQVFAPFFRMGSGGSVVDNAFSGGIFATVDETTGIVISQAVNKSGQSFIKHPDTGVTIMGFQLPEWDKAVAFVQELATVVKGNRYTAWDLAYTDNGWVMIEGNARGEFVGQMADKRGRLAQLMELIKEE